MEQSHSWEANRFSANQEIPNILLNPKVHNHIHKCPQLSLSWSSYIKSTPPHPTSWRSILILSSHLRLGPPSALLPLGFPTKTLYRPLLYPIRATCCTHPILLDLNHPNNIGWGYRTLSSSLCSFLHFPVTSSLLCPNILLNNLFSNTLSRHSSFKFIWGQHRINKNTNRLSHLNDYGTVLPQGIPLPVFVYI